MKRTIIESMTYPRMMMLSHLDADRCPLHLRFDPSYQKCRGCDRRRECQWLTDHNEFQVLSEKPVEHLYGAMLFCIDFMESRSMLDGHNISRCACEGCMWIRDTKYLGHQLSEQLASLETAAAFPQGPNYPAGSA